MFRQEFPGRVTAVPSYDEMNAVLARGDNSIFNLCETLTLAAVVRDHGTPAQKLRLAQEIQASRWTTEIMTRTEE